MTCRRSTESERESCSRVTRRYRIATLAGIRLRDTVDDYEDFPRKRRRRGRMDSRTAISAGALALALAAIPVVSSPALAEAVDCKRGDGLLSGVTNGLCDVVEAVTGTVDSLTGDKLKPVTKKVGGTADDLLGTVGDAVPTTIPTRSGQPQPTPSDQELLPNTLSEVCLPVLACEHQDAQQRNKDPEHVLETPSPEHSATPSPTAKPNKREKKDSTTTSLPTDG